MAEGWVECPALGPGWKRREAFRKSGATCGRTDTYYQSPTGEKFRSKIELSRFLGPARDLANFDFKNGLERPGGGKPRKGPRWHRPSEPPRIAPLLQPHGEPEEAEPESRGAEPESRGEEPQREADQSPDPEPPQGEEQQVPPAPLPAHR